MRALVEKYTLEEADRKQEGGFSGKKPGAQKGIPDWLQELYDPLESIMNSKQSTTTMAKTTTS